MSPQPKDPSEPIRVQAASYPEVEQGTSCTQSSFKAGKTAFLYIGMQGGRHKAMFKLKASIPEAKKLAEEDPDSYQVGNTAWVTARFTAENPLPKKIWKKWLNESYELSTSSASKKSDGPRKKVAKKGKRKKVVAKKSTSKTPTKKKKKKSR